MRVNPQPLWIVMKDGKPQKAYSKYDSAKGWAYQINGTVETVLLYGYKEVTIVGLNR